jgi:hypothetical protein
MPRPDEALSSELELSTESIGVGEETCPKTVVSRNGNIKKNDPQFKALSFVG